MDDWLWNSDAHAAPLFAPVLLVFLSALGVPLSWHKLEFGVTVRWIGWDLAFDLGTVSIPADKRSRVLALLQSVVATKSAIQRKELEKGLGLLVWASWSTPLLRPWLSAFFLPLPTQLLTAVPEYLARTVGDSSGFR